MLRIGPGANYLLDVLPPVAIFGCGLALLVAPLTSTVLAALDVRLAGTASGVNNAVARTAGLIAVAALPAVAGLRGRDYDDPAAFNDAFRMVVFVCVALLALAALLTACTIADDAAVRRARAVPDHGVLRLEPGVVTPEPAERIPLPHCAIAVPFPATPNQPSPGDPPGPKQASWS
jgi:hypothetical protein